MKRIIISMKYLSIFFCILMLLSCASPSTKNMTPQFRVKDIELAKGIDTSGKQETLISPTTVFTTADEQVISHIQYENLVGSHTFRWEWIDPQGKLYYSTKDMKINSGAGKYIKKGTTWHNIPIKGEKAEELVGNWKVDIYMNNVLISSQRFQIMQKLTADVDMQLPKTKMMNPDAIAVVIGNSNYQNPDVPKVTFAIRDAETVRQYLINVLGYKPGNIIFRTDATKAKFEAIFGIIGNYKAKLHSYVKPKKSDVFIYYSGHGAPDTNSKKGYFVPIDSDPAQIAFSGYPLELFYDNLNKLEAKSITVVLDACFSGGTNSGKLMVKNASPIFIKLENQGLATGNIRVIASSQGDQISSWYDEKQHGLFTYFFLKGLNGGADKNFDRKITYQELYNFIADRTDGVPYWARRLHNGREQIPTITGGENDAVLIELSY